MAGAQPVAADVSLEWTDYGGLDGPGLDRNLWSPGNPPLPDGARSAEDPGAEIVVADQTVSVTIPRFSHAHDSFQPADNVKFLMFSQQLALPEVGPATFGVDMAITTLGASSADIRLGMASLNVVDERSGLVFDIGGTSTRMIAVHEALSFAVGEDAAFTYLVESPFVDLSDDLTRFRSCEIVLDRDRGSAEWLVDGQAIYRQTGVPIPAQVKFGFGLFTLYPIRDGVSRSVQGQGLRARWRRFRHKGAAPVNP
jgi:Family of unknown function (DUF6081)